MSMWDEMNKAVGISGVSEEKIAYMDSGIPPLNKITSGRFDGGFPNGKMIEIYGESSSGKTLIATNLMIAAQQAGGAAIFIDFERSFNVVFATKNGLNPKQAFAYHKPRHWEEGNMKIIETAQWIRKNKLIPDDAPIVAVFDSVAAAPARSTVEKGLDELNMNDTTALARVASTTLKSIKQLVDDCNVTLLYLNQTRDDIGVMYGPKTKTPGGKALGFFMDARFETKRKLIVDEKTKEQTGQEITIKNIKSKFCRPFQKFTIPVMFGSHGEMIFDVVAATVDFAVDRGIIKGSGSRIEWGGKNLYKSQVITALKADPSGLKALVAFCVKHDDTVEADMAAGSDADLELGIAA